MLNLSGLFHYSRYNLANLRSNSLKRRCVRVEFIQMSTSVVMEMVSFRRPHGSQIVEISSSPDWLVVLGALSEANNALKEDRLREESLREEKVAVE